MSVKNGNHAVNPNNFVRDRTLNKLGAGNYFKILLLESKMGDLIGYSDRRGTSVEVILRSYNVDQKF